MSNTSPDGLTPLPGSPDEVRAYVSDMLSQLADMARSLGDRRLEGAIRLLALEAAAQARDTPGYDAP